MKKFRILAITFMVIMLYCMSCMAFAEEAVQDERPYSMAYLYGQSTDTYKKYLEHTNHALTEVAPDFFGITEKGTLIITSTAKKSFVKYLHDSNISVTPFISNHWDREKGKMALYNRDYLTTELANAVAEYDLDGVNIDIENVTETERADYVEFVRLLREKLGYGKIISVAVAANSKGLKTGWHGSYDYEKLAEYADYLIIMGYDESYSGSPAGPVASGSFVEKSIQYGIEHAPSEKLVLAVPFYGRFWNSDDSIAGKGVSIVKVQELVNNYKSNVVYSPSTESVKATVTISDDDEKPIVTGTTLDTGTYTFWYENETSLKRKIDLVHKYNLKGTGIWQLGQEPEETWDFFGAYLVDNVFYDIADSWAKNTILNVYNKGWMNGTEFRTFSPDKNITRAEVIVTLVRALGLADKADDYSDESFNDTEDHWANEQICIARKLGITDGVGKNKFNPDGDITRAEVSAMIDRTLDLADADTDITFSDVDKTSWAYASIMRLASANIIKGFPNGKFKANANMTRAEMATLLERIAV